MAEEARVYSASNVEEAHQKAAKLFYEPWAEYLPWYSAESKLKREE